MSTVSIPVPLRKLTNGADTVITSGSSVREIINNLEAGYPGILERLLTSDSKLRTFINIYINDEDIRFMNDLDTLVKETDEISILPAIAGG
jgi:molybdopterin synthase sulfur carrier subunit